MSGLSWLRIAWPRWWATDPEAVEEVHADWLAAATEEAHRATVVRRSPGWDRLDSVMAGEGKATPDAMNPASFNLWW